MIAFGYRESKANVTANADGSYHLELNDKPTTSIGEVKKIYPKRRDSCTLSFPCYQVHARSACSIVPAPGEDVSGMF
jgi:hypothetical protein